MNHSDHASAGKWPRFLGVTFFALWGTGCAATTSQAEAGVASSVAETAQANASVRSSTEAAVEESTPTKDTAQRYYEVVFIWVKDPEKFNEYLTKSAPIVQRYGGSLERMLVPDEIYAKGIEKPDIVNIVYYDSAQAVADMNRDPDFKAVVHLRTESIDMIAVGGVAAGGVVTQNALKDRTYLVEIAEYSDKGAAGYRTYETEAEPVMEKYGYHVERTLSLDKVSGFPFPGAVAKIAYFDSPDGMEKMHGDPLHDHIETELYPAATGRSAWVIGHVHPMTLGAPQE
ncbi:MAG: DUF1330 domain-containing protein [Nannocystaceae bacterium]|nr:DUF1330 domain-containing protein [Nannocystaceae bacterium]